MGAIFKFRTIVNFMYATNLYPFLGNKLYVKRKKILIFIEV